MSRIVIDYSLKTKEKIDTKRIFGIKRQNNIVFKDNDYNTNLLIENNKINMKRENNEIISEFIFDKISKCKLYLKDYNKYIDFDVKLISLLVDDNIIKIEYELNDEKVDFEIKYEVI